MVDGVDEAALVTLEAAHSFLLLDAEAVAVSPPPDTPVVVDAAFDQFNILDYNGFVGISASFGEKSDLPTVVVAPADALTWAYGWTDATGSPERVPDFSTDAFNSLRVP